MQDKPENKGPEGDPAGWFGWLGWLVELAKTYPFLGYTFVLIALLVASRTATRFGFDLRQATFICIIGIGLLFVSLQFARATKLSQKSRPGDSFLVWVFNIALTIVIGLIISSVWFAKPLDLRHWVDDRAANAVVIRSQYTRQNVPITCQFGHDALNSSTTDADPTENQLQARLNKWMEWLAIGCTPKSTTEQFLVVRSPPFQADFNTFGGAFSIHETVKIEDGVAFLLNNSIATDRSLLPVYRQLNLTIKEGKDTNACHLTIQEPNACCVSRYLSSEVSLWLTGGLGRWPAESARYEAHKKTGEIARP